MIETWQSAIAAMNDGEITLILLFVVLFVIRLCFMLFFDLRLALRTKRCSPAPAACPFSVLVTVRNEAENLQTNLPPLLSAEGVDFETIVVDDFSQDDSYLVLGRMKTQFGRLKISMLNQETLFSSKLAENIALKAAGNEWVVLMPIAVDNTNPEWLYNLSGQLDNHHKLVIAYASVQPLKKGFNILYRMENYSSFAKSAGYILNGVPFVYKAENVAFRKSDYFNAGGYGKRLREHYASLELIINTYIRKNSTKLLLTRNAVMRKMNHVSIGDYLDLLRKNFRIEKHLPVSRRIVLRLDEISHLLYVPVVVATVLAFPVFWMLFLPVLALKALTHLFIIKRIQKHLNEPKLFLPSFIYGLLAPYFKIVYRWYFNRSNQK